MFNPSESSSKDVEELRLGMMSDLKEFLGGNRDPKYFRVEGIAILIPTSIGFHKDSINCPMPGMQTVLSVNATIPINDRTFPSGRCSKVRQWLDLNGYKKSHPCSIILYT